jgi:hypothetical protein
MVNHPNRSKETKRRADEEAEQMARHAAYVAEGRKVPATCFPCPICTARAGEQHRNP